MASRKQTLTQTCHAETKGAAGHPKRGILRRRAGGRWARIGASLALALLLLLAPSQNHSAYAQSCPSLNITDTATGTNALASECGGFNNTADGFDALEFNTTGHDNTAAGEGALALNTLGSDNTAAGVGALEDNIEGYFNTADGYFALASNNAGLANTAAGYQALEFNSADGNTADGFNALNQNTTGGFNTAAGYQALEFNTTGQANTAAGYQALTSNNGDNNTAAGNQALDFNSTGNDNTAAGVASLAANNGNHNTATGYRALNLNSTGDNNTGLGWGAGLTSTFSNANTTGSNDTFLGYNSGPGTSAQLTNATAIGANALVDESNALVLGGTGANAVKVGIGTASPTSTLTVAGTIEFTSGGIKFPNGSVQTVAGITMGPGDAGTYLRSNGTAWTASDIQAGDLPAGSTYYIQNGTSLQTNASFHIDGSGTLGGTLTVGSGSSSVAGSLGIGTVSPHSLLQVGTPSTSYGSYLQLPMVTTGSVPPVSDCNASTFVGRLVLQYDAAKVRTTLWSCSAGGVWTRLAQG